MAHQKTKQYEVGLCGVHQQPDMPGEMWGCPLLDSQQKPLGSASLGAGPVGLCSKAHQRQLCMAGMGRGGIPGQGTSPPRPCRRLTFHSARTNRANSRSPPSVLPTMIQMGICQSSCLEISKVICRADQAEALLGTGEQL